MGKKLQISWRRLNRLETRFCRKYSLLASNAWDDELVYPASAYNCRDGHNTFLARSWALRIMCMSSIPASVASADRKDLKPSSAAPLA
jgi:hypothetical protein